jgi:hypothetical protein
MWPISIRNVFYFVDLQFIYSGAVSSSHCIQATYRVGE